MSTPPPDRPDAPSHPSAPGVGPGSAGAGRSIVAPTTFEQLVHRADELRSQRRHVEACELELEGGRLFPRIAAAQALAAEAALKLRRPADAREFLKRARMLVTARTHAGLKDFIEELAVAVTRLSAREDGAAAPERSSRVRARSARKEPPAPPRPRTPGPAPAPPPPPRAGGPPLEVGLSFRPVTVQAFPSEADPARALADYRLRLSAQAVALLSSFDTLLALDHVRGVDRYDYQLRTVRRVLREFFGRALLADEVGLGKTVEACLCLKEYLLRGLVSRVLILVPPALRGQWRDELANKFGIEARVVEGDEARADPDVWKTQGVLLASLGMARLEPHAGLIAEQSFDLLIVDEAHRLKNRRTRSWQLVDRLRARFLLLLSATPVENDLGEIHNLLSLLKPGLFSTEAEFKRAFLAGGRSRVVRDPGRLRSLLREVMIRNTRALAEAKLPPRYATTLRAAPEPAESELGERLAAAVRAGLVQGRFTRAVAGEILRAAGSSPRAAAPLLARLDPELAARALALERPAKDALLADLLAKRRGEKVLVFAAHRATLEHVAGLVPRCGLSTAVFHGQLGAAEKEAVIADFRERADVLVSSESGGEGFNLHFARTIVNYDLPWNPMRIEQRIGRVHRIGQTREVFVFNLVTRGTIEEEILRVLDEKINMFELVVGEVEAILGRLGDDEQEFQELVLELYAGASDAEDVRRRFDALAERMLAARGEYQGVKQLEEAAFGRDLEA